MTRRRKVFVGTALILLFAMSFAVSWGLWTLERSGAILVSVNERGGDHIAVRLPGAIVTLAALLAPDEIFRGAGCGARGQIPIMRAACKSIQESPDFVLVECEGRNEHVSVSKHGGKFLVRVETPEESVHIELPVFLFRTIVGKIDRANRA